MAALAAALVLAGACASRSRPGVGDVRESDAVVVIGCEVADAAVWVDGRYVAQVRHVADGVALAPGAHRIEIHHERYHTFYARVSVEPRERRTLDVDLAPRLP